MPQEFHVLQCFSCNVFQVDIIKKVPKWSCKMCGEKQSVKRVYFKGSGKECRLQVQELNEKRIRLDSRVFEQVAFDSFPEIENGEEQTSVNNKENSKWSTFLPNVEPNEGSSCDGVESDGVGTNSESRWNRFLSCGELNNKDISEELPICESFKRAYCEEEDRDLSNKKFKSHSNRTIEEGVDNQHRSIFECLDNESVDALLDL